ncbi:MAG: flagellar basal body rod protein FlgB [Thermodesulfobacteriota bacterium]
MSELLGRKLFDKTILYLQRSLGLRTLNQRVISNNITNAHTPGYTPKEIPFQRLLDQALEKANGLFIAKTNAQHLPNYPEESYLLEAMEEKLSSLPTDEEVQIEKEMAKLAANNLMFQAEVQALLKKLEALKLTISEGR